MFELLQMWLLVEVLGLLGLPLAFSLFRHVPDRGFAFSKTIGIIVFVFCTWFPLVSLQFLPYSRLFLLSLILTFAAISGFVWSKKWQSVVANIRQHWQYVVAVELVFTSMLFLLGILRSFKPDIQGFEMFMDEGFVASIMRSPHLPPNDMWLSGYSINYYYYAHFVIATLAKLLGHIPSVAFNTGISLCFGLTAVNLFGVTCNIVASGRALYKKASVPSLWVAIPYGLLSMVMALIMGNLAATQQWWKNHDMLNARFDWFAPSRVIQNTINEFPSFSFILSCFHAHVLTLAFTILCIAFALNIFLNADGKGLAVFGRGYALPINLSVVAIVLGGLYLMNGWDLPTYMGLTLFCIALQQVLAHKMRISIMLFVRVGLVSGLLIALAYTAYLPFHLEFVSPSQGYGFVTPELHSAVGDELLIYGVFAFVFVSLLLCSLCQTPLALFVAPPPQQETPFLPEEQPYEEQHSDDKIAFEDGTIGYAFSMLPPSSGLGHEPSVAVATIEASIEEEAPVVDEKAAKPKQKAKRVVLLTMGVVCLLGFVVALDQPGNLTLILASCLALIGTILMFFLLGNRAHSFTLLLGAAAFTVVAGCEVFYLKDIFAGGSYMRMNTIFKFYFQAWMLLSICAASGLYFIVERFWQSSARSISLRWLQRTGGLLWLLCFLFLLSISMAYPIQAPFARYSKSDALRVLPYMETDFSLDGLSYLEHCQKPNCEFATYGDYKAIRWLNEHIEGAPVIVEATGGAYQYTSRISTFTGLPTLLGWQGHETQWRFNWFNERIENRSDFQRRGTDIEIIYTHPDSSMVLAAMKRYNAQYLYVGPYEIQKFLDTDLHRFKKFMHVVYEADGVTIYQPKN